MAIRVLVTTDSRDGGGFDVSHRVRPRKPEYWIKQRYIEAVRAAGGLPLLLPPGCRALEAALEGIDAVVITGGATDIDPAAYGQPALGRLDRLDAPRTDAELSLARLCVARDLPVLGVCGGMQVLAVATGGALYQDIATDLPAAGQHEQLTDPAHPWHDVHFEPGVCREIFGPLAPVNSTHHQAVRDPGALAVTGRAPDGVVEAIELPGHRFCVGLQWHPELLGFAPYEALIRAALG
jgi:putative glutamine amidotransferase